MTTPDLDVTIDPRADGAYLLRWRCSELCRGSDLVVADDRAPDRWRAIADVRIPGAPDPASIAESVATTAHSGCAAAASRTASRSR